ncbi:MAG TPA: hypothetical protein VNN25_11780 [Thermoanaerobaculia bacterium]|nr:hypothetical protein [Thermoanaerobaculia bacterium]
MADENESAVEDQQPFSKPVEAELTPEERKHRAFQRAIALKGKFHLDIDLDELRGRSRIEARASDVYDGDMANRNQAAVIDRQTENKPVETELTPEERRHRAFQRLQALKGKIHLDIDIDELRGRNR